MRKRRVILLLALGFPIIMAAVRAFAPQPPVRPGFIYQVEEGNALAASEDVLLRFAQARRAQEWNAEFGMKREDLLTPLEPAAQVVVKRTSRREGAPTALVIVVAGMHRGQDGWVLQSWLKNPRSGQSGAALPYPDLGLGGTLLASAFVLIVMGAIALATLADRRAAPPGDRNT